MDARVSRFSRPLLVLMVVLYLVSLGAFTYTNWQLDPSPRLQDAVFNGLILSIPLVLFFGALYLLGRAWYERRVTGSVAPAIAKAIRWAPRAGAIMIIFFVSLFSLDVFGMGGTFLETLVGLLMHNLPTIAMIILLVFAWRRPLVGAIAFLLAGLFFLRFLVGGDNWGILLLFSGPLLLISALFYTDWRQLQPPHPASADAGAPPSPNA